MSLLVVALMAPAIAQNAGKQITAFVNVNVIPMDQERLLSGEMILGHFTFMTTNVRSSC
jgi:hypothetical protein